jgi:aspartyl protease family protein
VIGWALRWVLLCCFIVFFGAAVIDRQSTVVPDRAARSVPTQSTEASRRAESQPSNTIVYAAGEGGHVIVDAAVNGAPTRLLVDTGASLVTLTPKDARAAGIDPHALVFSRQVSTANGAVRMAPVTLREIRLGQLSIYDVPAAVLEKLNVSLLGMSFLGRLQSYEMRDGKLTISW